MYIDRWKAPTLAYLNLTRKGQDSLESQVFEMTLILIVTLPNQTFSKRMRSIINYVSTKKLNGNGSTSIKADRLRMIVDILKQNEAIKNQSSMNALRQSKLR